ncbi:glycosyltransferase family 2 protein [Pontimonas sp.]|nr:glycosyltransferase family 2 protein [Pontimonas sp.]MDB4607154.1 glycosyltransferase family 2 protein [Pontimonas sp.]MDC0991605.1 glycosyltransferase family 2 protein [Pontimonas sp.]
MQEEAERPSISVVMCTFNGERFVVEQLESILTQTVTPEEIIISDDGSSDSTLAVVDKVRQASDVPVRWDIQTRENPLGPAKNFESALKRATGDVIALADQDDVWMPHKLETLTAALTNSPRALVAHSDARLVDDSGRNGSTLVKTLALTRQEKKHLRSGRAIRALLKRNLVTGATMVISRKLLDTALPIPDGWIHDEWLAVVAALQDGVVFDEGLLISYRQHSSNAIGAQQLGPAIAQERLGESRTAFSARKALRNKPLAALAVQQPRWLPAHHVGALRAKVDFDASRAKLPHWHLARVFPVLQSVLAGHYRNYARGWIDVIRDLSLRS